MTEIRRNHEPGRAIALETPIASPNPRIFSISLACIVVLAGDGLLFLGLRLTDPLPLVAYAISITILLIGWRIYDKRLATLRHALTRERALLVSGVFVFALAYPLLAGNPYQVHVLAMGGIMALMGLGLNVNIGYAGLADFGYIAYFAIGAYVSAVFNVKFGLNFWLCVPLAGIITAVLSLLVSLPALRVKGHYLALVTLGFAFIVIQLITNLENITGGAQGISGIAQPSLFGHSFSTPLHISHITAPYEANFYYLILISLTLAAVACTRLTRSRWGRAWTAMQADDIAAESSGLNLVKLKLIAFCTGASFGGIAGSMYAHMIGYIDPSSFRIMDSVLLLAIVVLGNFRVGGVIAAAMIFTVLPEKLRAFDDWRLFIFGVALLGIMLIRGRRMVQVGR